MKSGFLVRSQLYHVKAFGLDQRAKTLQSNVSTNHPNSWPNSCGVSTTTSGGASFSECGAKP